MVDYYSDLSREVAKLGPTSAEGRGSVYERTRKGLVDQFADYNSRMSKADYERERNSLEQAIARVENELGAQQSSAASPTLTGNVGNASAYAILDYSEVKLKEQVANYDRLTFIQTERGGAIITLIIVVFLPTMFSVLTIPQQFSPGIKLAFWSSAFVIYVIPTTILSIFIWRGHRWAMIATMGFWAAFGIGLVYLLAFEPGGLVLKALALVFAAVVWSIVFRLFYRPFRVEQARRAKK